MKNLVSSYIEEMAGKARSRAPKSVTFSIRLSEREHAKLLWLAENLDTQKTPLAEKLLKAAVDEAVDQYARWASPEEPEKFLEEAFAGIEDLEKGSSAHEPPPPPPHHHGPPPPPPHHHGPPPLPPPGHKHPR
ncbi:MAG: hypothetical protein LC751_04940 [Actinobacteria bacterium]|nr:hypothetical protein [Actinomycetota bacterium]